MGNTIQETRLLNTLKLASRYKFEKEFCEKIGILPAYFSQVKHKNKNIGSKIARQIEDRLGLENGFLDVQHDKARAQDRSSANTLAMVIEQMPDNLRDQVTRLVYSIASELPDQEKKIIDR